MTMTKKMPDAFLTEEAFVGRSSVYGSAESGETTQVEQLHLFVPGYAHNILHQEHLSIAAIVSNSDAIMIAGTWTFP